MKGQPPGILHEVLRYENGEWIREGRAVPGSQADGLHEDRVAMMLDDGKRLESVAAQTV